MEKETVIGKPLDRIDGPLKVSGTAKYAAEFNQKNMAYAFPVRSTIASGSISSIDISEAKKAPGVVNILTHENAPKLAPASGEEFKKSGASVGENFIPMQDNQVHYWGQYIALVIAETYEEARMAAAMVKVNYTKGIVSVNLEKALPGGFRPEKSNGQPAQINAGKTQSIIDSAAVKVDHSYSTSTENHHPMEPHASVAVWNGESKVTLYSSSQGVIALSATVAYFFKLKPENVQIINPFVGGGFGSKGSEWGQGILATMAAKVVKRPVKLVITRQMMQTNVGRRSETIQKVALASDRNGKLQAIRHENGTYANLSEYFEPSGKQSAVLYASPLREITHKVAKLNIGTPTFMRAPGETPGVFALETAMDELAYELKMDPIELRRINHTAVDPMKNHPFSSEYLLDCYTIGAEKFGWNKRDMKPGKNKVGNQLIGYGMATATYPAIRSSASAKVQLKSDGSFVVMCATQDIGTGTYTIMAQTAAEALGVDVKNITVKLGDSSLPPGPVSGGSTTTASVNPAVYEAAKKLRNDLLILARADSQSPLYGKKTEDINFSDGLFYLKNDPAKKDAYVAIMLRHKKTLMEGCVTAMPASGSGLGSQKSMCSNAEIELDENGDAEKYSFHSFGAQFAEVWVDEDFGTVRVKRFVSVHDVGTIMNEKTARSQILGGVIYGFGSALMEETVYDQRYGNPVTRTLADYHVPVNLDVPEIDVYFIGKKDPHISPIGARGIGEIGITGVSAAIGNAIFNATGKRLRDLPFTPDKLV
ncbi:xanthine dehydrogenase family protein molybdopterin-binding subunit [Halpernia frigidisoli]|uniref:Xanthine dehydrogenase, molybdenum binding subunit apoprotein n=1 Tax=Halpernia frigidisoli TaxID=1125876 RepID=A0A1I3D5A9_9FLAO|nr:xanthine dehydrogenase family protein molybdopterin-binding subunit [Halpernia frigidisoli]SFH81729.1 xanthine dehydrogenase, molybdenum binding subunit apoprotein [Halpernia frigidisoli]